MTDFSKEGYNTDSTNPSTHQALSKPFPLEDFRQDSPFQNNQNPPLNNSPSNSNSDGEDNDEDNDFSSPIKDFLKATECSKISFLVSRI